jgi:hypothetical protein
LSTRATAGFSVIIKFSVVHLVPYIIADRLIATKPFVEHLLAHKHVSPRTVSSYRDTFRGSVTHHSLLASLESTPLGFIEFCMPDGCGAVGSEVEVHRSRQTS